MDLEEVFVNGWVSEVDNYYNHLDGINLIQTPQSSQDSGVFSDDDDSRETVCLSPVSEDEENESDDLFSSPSADQTWGGSQEISQNSNENSVPSQHPYSGSDADHVSHPSTRVPLQSVVLPRTSSLESAMMNLDFRRETEGKLEPRASDPVDNKENQTIFRGLKRRRYSESSMDLQRSTNSGTPGKMKRSSSLNESSHAICYELNDSITCKEKKDSMRVINDVRSGLKSANILSNTLEISKYLSDTVRKKFLIPANNNHGADYSVQSDTKQTGSTSQDCVCSVGSQLHSTRTTNQESICRNDNESELIGSIKESVCNVNNEPPKLVRLKCLSPGEKFRQTRLPMNTNPMVYEWEKSVTTDDETPQRNPRKRLLPDATETSPPKVLKTSPGIDSFETVQRSSNESNIFKIPTSLPPRKRSKMKPKTIIC